MAHPHTSAGRVPTEAGYRYFVDELLPREPAQPAPRAVAVARPARGRRGDARHDRDPVAGDQPARDRDRAADRDLDDPAHRGAVAAAAGADGRRDHLDRRRHQAAVHVLRAGRRGPGRLGRELPERAARRVRPRRADAPPAAPRPVAGARRARVPGRARAGVHRPRGGFRGGAVRRGRLAAAARRPIRRRVRAQQPDGHARAAGGAARGAARRAHRARRDRSGSGPRTTCQRCGRSRSWPPATGCRSGGSARSR